MKLKLKVVPGASKNEIIGWLNDRLKIRIAAPPESGKANKAVILLLSKELNILAKSIVISSGLHSPQKTVSLPSSSFDKIEQFLIQDKP